MRIANRDRLIRTVFLVLGTMSNAFTFGMEAQEGFDKDTIAIDVGTVQLTFFELAQMLALPPNGEGEPCNNLRVSESLQNAVDDTILSAIGIEHGLLDTADFRKRQWHIQKAILWQHSEVQWIMDLEHVHYSDSYDCILEIEPANWSKWADLFSFLSQRNVEELDKDQFLIFSINGEFIGNIYHALEERNSLGSKKDLHEFLHADFRLDESLLEWQLGSQTGSYSLEKFLEDFGGMPMRKQMYSHVGISNLIIGNFLSREYYLQALESGLVEEKELELGFLTYARRYARGEFKKELQKKIEEPTRAELADFYQKNISSFTTPKEIRVRVYKSNATSRKEAVRESMEVRLVKGDASKLASRETLISPTDSDFWILHRLKLGDVSSIVKTSEGEFIFYQILGKDGTYQPTLEEVSHSVEAKLKDQKLKEMLKSKEEAFLKSHDVILFPNIENILCSDMFRDLKIRKRSMSQNSRE